MLTKMGQRKPKNLNQQGSLTHSAATKNSQCPAIHFYILRVRDLTRNTLLTAEINKHTSEERK